MAFLGAHMSISGGIHLAPGRGKVAGCDVIQIFTQNANQWRGKMPTESEIALFQEEWAASGVRDIVSHDIYLINLAAAPGDVREKSIAAFRQEMERCSLLGIDKIVMHPGSHVGAGEETGLSRIIEAFNLLIPSVPQFRGKILLETTAGQGSNLGYSFEHLQTIITGSEFPEHFGICFDTCHTFAAGYDLTTESGYSQVFGEFDRIIGLERLCCFHVNDSIKGLGCRIDRHEHIGRGAMGLDAFRQLMNDHRFANIPKILETPKGDHEEMDEINLNILRSL